jgi:nucleoside-diphosphate-sugar epimerase
VKYFVTGSTGFIGGRLTRRLLTDGHQVVSLVRSPSRAADLARDGAILSPGDITGRESMRSGMTGVDGVFHLAAWYKVGARDTSPAWRINVEGTRNVLSLAAELGVPRVVYTSTLAVLSDTGGRLVDESYRPRGPWLSEYDRTKWTAHFEVAEPMMREGLSCIIVVPGVVYGPGDYSLMGVVLQRFLRRRLPILPRRSAYCWGHVDDTVDGHLLAMEKGRPGESYIIAGPDHTLIETIELAARITGIPAPRLRVDPAVLRAAAVVSRVVGTVLRLPAPYRAEALRVAAGVTYLGSSAKAKRELGFDPRPLETGLTQTLRAEAERLGVKLPRA